MSESTFIRCWIVVLLKGITLTSINAESAEMDHWFGLSLGWVGMNWTGLSLILLDMDIHGLNWVGLA